MKENGFEYVALGLPSGTMWTICNVGADKPEDDRCYVMPVKSGNIG